MAASKSSLQRAVDGILESLPPVWDRIRANLRAAGTGEFGITIEQFRVLRQLRKGAGSVSELAERRQVSRAAVSQAVDVLVAKGLVTRLADASDRRCVRLELTDRARAALDANYETNRAWMKERMSGLSREELDCVRRAMDILKDSIAPEN
jgi:Transcriptional regulators